MDHVLISALHSHQLSEVSAELIDTVSAQLAHSRELGGGVGAYRTKDSHLKNREFKSLEIHSACPISPSNLSLCESSEDNSHYSEHKTIFERVFVFELFYKTSLHRR